MPIFCAILFSLFNFKDFFFVIDFFSLRFSSAFDMSRSNNVNSIISIAILNFNNVFMATTYHTHRIKGFFAIFPQSIESAWELNKHAIELQ